MTRRDYAIRYVMLGGWLLMMPPVPLGTSLPPVSAWSRMGEFDTSANCENAKNVVRGRANRMITNDPTADAASLAVAMGALQTRCVETKPVEPPAETKPVPPPAKNDSAKAPATK